MSSNTSQFVAGEASGDATLAPRPWIAKLASLGRLLSPDIVATVATSFVLFGMLTVQGVFLARMLGPESRGEYATAVFYTQTLLYVGMFGTQHAVTRWSARRKHDAPRLVRTIRRLGLLTGFATMAAVTVLAIFALPPDKQSLAPLCVLCACFLPLEHVRLMWLAVDQGRGNFKQYNYSRLAGGLAFPAMLGIAWACGFNTVLMASVLFVLAPIVGLIYQRSIHANDKTAARSAHGPSVKKLLQRGRPYALAVMVSDICDRLDIFLFLWLASFTAQGYYAAAVPSANLLLVIPIALAVFAFNAGARRDNRPTLAKIAKSSAAIFGVQALFTVVYAILLEPLMVLVFGQDFRGAVPLTLALLPAYGVAGCGRVAEAFLQGRNRAILGVYSRLVGAAAMGTFVYCTFDRWAEMSIPLGALVGYIVSTAILWTVILLDAPKSRAETLEATL
jgi:O-antigen/teichoic acid export membrane protein